MNKALTFCLYVCWMILWLSLPLINHLPNTNLLPELLKVKIFLSLSTVCFVFALLKFLLSRSHLKFHQPMAYSLLAWTFIAFASLLWSVNPYHSFWGNYYRDDGLWTFLHLLMLPLILVLHPKLIRFGLWSIGLANLAMSAAIVFSAFNFYLHTHDLLNLAHLNFAYPQGHGIFTAGYLAVSYPFLFYLSQQVPLPRSFFTLIKLIPILAILFTHSIGGIMAMLLIFWLYIFFRTPRPIKITLVLVLLLGTIYMLLQLTENPVSHPDSRIRIFITLILSLPHRPQGWGWANVDAAFSFHDWPIARDLDIYVDKAHSHWLEVLVATGVLGFLSYIFLQYQTFRQLQKNSKISPVHYYVLVSLLAFIFHSQTNVISISEEAIFWFCLGIALQGSYSWHVDFFSAKVNS